MEYGLRVNSVDLLRALLYRTYTPKNNIDNIIYVKMKSWREQAGNPPINYIYYGSEFCAYRSPSINEWAEVADICLQFNKILVMIIPPMNVHLEK